MENSMATTTKTAKSNIQNHLPHDVKTLGKEVLDSDFAGQITEKWNQLRDRSEDVYNSSVDVVRKYPIATVSTALAVGVLAGMILKRRH